MNFPVDVRHDSFQPGRHVKPFADALAQQGVTAFAMEMSRITRPSQWTFCRPRVTCQATKRFLMPVSWQSISDDDDSSGHHRARQGFCYGVGVAGLQAIATAKCMGGGYRDGCAASDQRTS